MKKNEKKYLYAIAGIAVIFIVTMQMGYLTQYGIPPFTTAPTGSNTKTPPSNTGADYSQGTGVFQLKCGASDTCAAGTSYDVGDTQVFVYPFHYIGGQWILDQNGFYDDDAAANYFTTKAEDNGFIYFAVDVPAGQSYYVDYAKMKAADSWIVGVQYTDVFGSGVKDWVFQYNLKNHAVPNSGYPAISFSVYLITYDSAPTGLCTLSNDTYVQTNTTKYYEWYLSMSAEKKGIAIYKIEIRFGNSSNAAQYVTDVSKASIYSLQIPGIGYVSGSQFSQVVTTADIRYDYTISNGLYGADYIYLMPNALNKFYMNLQLNYNLGASDDIPVYLYIYYLVPPTGTGTSLSSSFNAFYGAK